MLRFDGRVAIVTGAARGLGLEYARMLAAWGARVVVNDVSKADIDTVARDIRRDGGEAIADYNDVSTSAGAIVEAAVAAFGGIDVLINNAGMTLSGRRRVILAHHPSTRRACVNSRLAWSMRWRG